MKTRETTPSQKQPGPSPKVPVNTVGVDHEDRPQNPTLLRPAPKRDTGHGCFIPDLVVVVKPRMRESRGVAPLAIPSCAHGPSRYALMRVKPCPPQTPGMTQPPPPCQAP